MSSSGLPEASGILAAERIWGHNAGNYWYGPYKGLKTAGPWGVSYFGRNAIREAQ